jgi:hypothetical protein
MPVARSAAPPENLRALRRRAVNLRRTGGDTLRRPNPACARPRLRSQPPKIRRVKPNFELAQLHAQLLASGCMASRALRRRTASRLRRLRAWAELPRTPCSFVAALKAGPAPPRRPPRGSLDSRLLSSATLLGGGGGGGGGRRPQRRHSAARRRLTASPRHHPHPRRTAAAQAGQLASLAGTSEKILE